MAEAQSENAHGQQQPFTEKGLSRMDGWLKTAGTEIKEQPQQNINRLFLLREFRTTGKTFAFIEKTGPKYAIEEDKNSDILMEWDTLTDGNLKLRLQLNDFASTIQTPYIGTNSKHYTTRFINEMIEIRNQLREGGVNIVPTLIDARGNTIDLPEKKIKKEEIVETTIPPKVPLKDQELSLDVHTGAWYGSPKTTAK